MTFAGRFSFREIKRLYDWPEHVWGRRYQAILVSEEEKAQVDRFRYLLSHGVKEGLMAHARNWPGVHCVRELLAGEPIRGLWFDRTAEYAARSRGEAFDRLKYATEQALELTPLPCWISLPRSIRREWHERHVLSCTSPKEIFDQSLPIG